MYEKLSNIEQQEAAPHQRALVSRALMISISAVALMGANSENVNANGRVVTAADVSALEQNIDARFPSVVPTPKQAKMLDAILYAGQEYIANNPPKVGSNPEDGYFCREEQNNWRTTNSIRIIPDAVMDRSAGKDIAAQTNSEYTGTGHNLCITIYRQSVINGDPGRACNIGAHETNHATGIGHNSDPNSLMYYLANNVVISECMKYYKKASHFFTPPYLAKQAIRKKEQKNITCRTERNDNLQLWCKSTGIKDAKKSKWLVEAYKAEDNAFPTVLCINNKDDLQLFDARFKKSVPSSKVKYGKHLITK